MIRFTTDMLMVMLVSKCYLRQSDCHGRDDDSQPTTFVIEQEGRKRLAEFGLRDHKDVISAIKKAHRTTYFTDTHWPEEHE